MRRPDAARSCPVAALAVLFLAAPTAFAQGADPTFPAIDCAALWQATADFRTRYAIAEGSPAEAQAMARAFRDAALAEGADRDGVDDRIAALRPVYLLLLQRYLLDGERRARDQYVRLSGLCDDLGRASGLKGHRHAPR
ncbi:hypothetical protein JMM59_02960 [Rhodovulum sulfidophilum]|uniref:hypothetical protein n=1 Tax=Rhodovulum sulfidophilum TaxID=35806 RepID=UPI00192171D2|nr:hypothetical protein [Rhodovulum sulfidophilum]MBL3563982.1 hypothetical protein [Rhodovulum sulfidophilum]